MTEDRKPITKQMLELAVQVYDVHFDQVDGIEIGPVQAKAKEIIMAVLNGAATIDLDKDSQVEKLKASLGILS